MSTVRHYRYTCAACGRQLDSTVARRRVEYDARYLIPIVALNIAVCRAASKCEDRERREWLLSAPWERVQEELEAVRQASMREATD